MTQATTPTRPFDPGTTGWTVADLADPEIQRHWLAGRYELVDGVLTKMAPQGFGGISPLTRLRDVLYDHVRATGRGGRFYHEVDVLIDEPRLPKPDMIYLTPEQETRQRELEKEMGIGRGVYTPVLVVPLLIVESLSQNHEDHDRRIKRHWYAARGVPNYWLLDPTGQTLECLVLRSGDYAPEVTGSGSDVIRPKLFGGVTVPLAELWL